MQTITKKTWLITIADFKRISHSSFPYTRFCHSYKGTNFSLYSNFKISTFQSDGQTTFSSFEGNLLPTLHLQNECKCNNILEYIAWQYSIKGEKIINDFKGNFILVIGNMYRVNIFSDHLGIKKFFYAQKNGATYVSNEIGVIREITNAVVNKNHIAIYSVTNRFISGITMFEGIFYSSPASNLSFDGKYVKNSTYWSPEEFFFCEKRTSDYEEYSNTFLSVIKQYLDFYEPKKISLTLTGGSDSRILLGSLLRLGHKPTTYTFGNPKSGDVIVAMNVAKALGLEYNNHYQGVLTASWFENLTNRIREEGNSIINYHRAYRLDGLLKEMENNPDSDITVVGHAGGEPIRGIYYDNLILTNLVKQWIPGNKQNRELLTNSLKSRFVNQEEVDFDYIINYLDNLPYLNKEGKEREFQLIFKLLIGNHLYQDINLYSIFHNQIIAPFMDIDYLRYLFSSPFSMIYKDNASRNQLDRLNIPELHCNVINIIYPELTKFRLNNGYSPSEYLNSKFMYLIKRGWRKYINPKPEPNFYYDSWFQNYIQASWPSKPDPWLKELFNLSHASDLLLGNNHGLTEKYWIKFSSIIMLDEFSKHY